MKLKTLVKVLESAHKAERDLLKEMVAALKAIAVREHGDPADIALNVLNGDEWRTY